MHLGHLAIATESVYSAGLEQVWFLPANQSPGKSPHAAASHRLRMLQLATQDDPLLAICDLELSRPGPSYTADSVAALRALHPRTEFALILGSDVLLSLESWSRAQWIAEQVELIGVSRPADQPLAEGHPSGLLRGELRYNGLDERGGIRFVRGASILQVPAFGISSQDIRRRLAENRPVRHLVPSRVHQYLVASRLYRP